LKSDGTILVQFFDTEQGQPQWRLLGMRRDGRPLFQIRNSPRLLALAGDANSLIFVHPGALVPSRWTIVQVKQ
jgi:hypothetical protein